MHETVGTVHAITAIIVSGVEPYLLHRDTIPVVMQGHILKFRKALKLAGNTTFSRRSSHWLTVNFGRHYVLILIGVEPVLATSVILEAAFIEQFDKYIEAENITIIPTVREAVPIIASS